MENANFFSNQQNGNAERHDEELHDHDHMLALSLSLGLGHNSEQNPNPQVTRSPPPPLRLPAPVLALPNVNQPVQPEPLGALPPMNPPIQQEPPAIQHQYPVQPSVEQQRSSFFILTPPPPPPPPRNHPLQEGHGHGPARPTRARRPQAQNPRVVKSQIITVFYPWSTNTRATVHSLEHLLSNGIKTISGQVQCKRCDIIYDMEYDLQQKFREVATYISENKSDMRDRAPTVWMEPTLPDCRFCKQSDCVKPIITKKRSINWLFLLLGQLLGCCRLDHLKYFCKHTRNHRTGAKDRVLYLTYLGLCKQLEPWGPFDV